MKKLSKRVDAALMALLYTAVFAGVAFLLNDCNSTWCMALTKPIFLLPPLALRLAWVGVYLIFAVAVWQLIYIPADKKVKTRQAVFFIILGALHLLWLAAVYKLHWLGVGLLILLISLLITYLSIKNSLKPFKVAGYLQIVYFVWLLYLIMVNYFLALLN